MRFRNKVCLVTGATKGIGLAIARRLAAEGGQVVVADVVGFDAETPPFEGDLPPYFVQLDVTSDDKCAAAVRDVMTRFGTVDVLVNNAGVYAKGDVVSTDPVTWDRIMSVNLTGAFLLTRHVVPHMIRQRGGAIVNIASEAGLVGIRGQVAYNVSKAGMIGFTRSLAVDLAPHGVRVNAVCPGTTWTPLVESAVAADPNPEAARRALEESRPLNRLGRPEEIAAAVCFLASDEAGYATGAMFSVDGGFTTQ